MLHLECLMQIPFIEFNTGSQYNGSLPRGFDLVSFQKTKWKEMKKKRKKKWTKEKKLKLSEKSENENNRNKKTKK